MPLRSVMMKRFIFGFQRRVWCPKWTPLSRSWRMVTTAMMVSPIGLFVSWGLTPACDPTRFLGTESRHPRAVGVRRERRRGLLTCEFRLSCIESGGQPSATVLGPVRPDYPSAVLGRQSPCRLDLGDPTPSWSRFGHEPSTGAAAAGVVHNQRRTAAGRGGCSGRVDPCD